MSSDGMKVLGKNGYKIRNVYEALYLYNKCESKITNTDREEMSLFFIPFKSNMTLSCYPGEFVENPCHSLMGQ